MRNCLILGVWLALLLSSVGGVYAQSGVMLRRYYDDETDLIKEEFTVRDTLSNVLEGPFVGYFSNGRVEMRGQFVNNQQEGHWEFYYENGNLRMEGGYEQGEVAGEWKYYYERQGNISAEGLIFDGQRQDIWVEYYESGQVKSEGMYLNGQRVGIWNYYYEDGTLKAQAFYESGRGIYEEYFASGKIKARGLNVEGKSDSTWQFFYESGILQSVGDYIDGLRQNHWVFYYENGEPKAEGDYRDGQPHGKWSYYYEDGTLNSEGALEMGHKEGFWQIYDRSGAQIAEGVFINGAGEYKEYYESGKLRAVGTMRDDQNEGQWYYYYESGELEGECFFVEGRGDYIGYYPDGSVKTKGLIEDGKWKGEWQLFAPDGELEAIYRPVYPEETPVFNSPPVTSLPMPESRGDYDKPQYAFREQRFTHFKPKPNEFVGIALGGNPLMFPLGWIPISAELVFKERLGYELEAGYVQSPFIAAPNDLGYRTQARGGYLAVRQKFYQPEKLWGGMPYYGHEIRYSLLSYNQQRELSSGEIEEMDGNGFRAEYFVVGGSRFMPRSTLTGFTVDVFLGLGIGYNHIPEGIQYPQLTDGAFSVRPWIGINAGWIISAKGKLQTRAN